MAGIKALRKIQGGREATAGTAVAATFLWRGMGTIEDQLEVVFPEEDIGLISGSDRTYIPKLLAALTMDETESTFEQLPYIGAAGILDLTTGVTDTGGSGKIYTYTMTTSTQATVRTYTLEGGDDQQEEEMEYSHVSSFTLSGKAGEAWKVGADWAGRQVTPSTFTGSIAIPSVEEMLFSKTKLYIDATTIGTTQKTLTLLEATLNVNTGLVPVFTADGQLYFSFIKQTQPEVTLDITFEHDGTAVAEKAAWRAQTARLIQLKCEGSTLTTAGSSYSVKTMLINLAGKYESMEKLGEQDGNDVLKATLRARYHSTSNQFMTMTIVNQLTSLT
jgi:hypothetical protein